MCTSGEPCSQNGVSVTGISNAVAVSGGGSFMCARLLSGGIDCWGSGSEGTLGDGSFSDSYTPAAVGGITNASMVAAGNANHACALLQTGSVACWGEDAYGELGSGGGGQAGDYSDAPVAVSGIP
jgi:alpha-tubulin suppressor-like RCC1 family protein